MTALTTLTEERALQLLGSGLPPATVASAIGITESRLSQLLSNPEFSAQVAQLRFTRLQKHNERDSKYDTIEDSLLERLKDCLHLMYKPQDILRAIQVINAAKRRGAEVPVESSQVGTSIQITLTLPTKTLHHFSVNTQNQVTEVFDTLTESSESLLTIQSSSLLSRLKALKPPEE